MKEQWRLGWLIASRELVDQLRDWRILAPMAILIFFLPLLMNFFTAQVVNFVNQYGANLVADRISPFMLIVAGFFPVTVSLVVALEAFVGEKERGTVEPLLSSPIADWQIYIGKLIAGAIVPLGAGYLSIILYLLSLWYRSMSQPPFALVFQIVVLNTVQTILMVSAAIVISTQSTSVRGANLLASFIVIPVGLLIQGESYLIFWGNDTVLWWASLAVVVLSFLFIRLGLAHFQREKLLGREIDVLNLGWLVRTFWREFSGGSSAPALFRYLLRKTRWFAAAQDIPSNIRLAVIEDFFGFRHWYQVEIASTLKKMRFAIVMILAIGLFTYVGTFYYVDSRLPNNTYGVQELRTVVSTFGQIDTNTPNTAGETKPAPPSLDDLISTRRILVNNVRASLIISILGILSFSVVGILAYMVNIVTLGGVMAAVKLIGLSPWVAFAAGILPHGIFELPALWLSIAAVLYVSLRIVTPEKHLSIGEVFVFALADWAKIFVAVCLPLFIIAALVEANLTRWIVELLLGRMTVIPNG